MYDIIGLNTAYAVSSTPGSGQENFAAYLKENYIDKGKLGVTTGEGFYKYPRN
ncbi:MAG TPA: 3-hydroxyacyl-CoA dehydrogenase family protein [Devosia sp.]|nr:3-hydroxyacyl-CoA dehydrogenase family protein [Devosia sp.]